MLIDLLVDIRIQCTSMFFQSIQPWNQRPSPKLYGFNVYSWKWWVQIYFSELWIAQSEKSNRIRAASKGYLRKETQKCVSQWNCLWIGQRQQILLVFFYTNVLVWYLLSIANNLKGTNEMERTVDVLFIWLVSDREILFCHLRILFSYFTCNASGITTLHTKMFVENS